MLLRLAPAVRLNLDPRLRPHSDDRSSATYKNRSFVTAIGGAITHCGTSVPLPCSLSDASLLFPLTSPGQLWTGSTRVASSRLRLTCTKDLCPVPVLPLSFLGTVSILSVYFLGTDSILLPSVCVKSPLLAIQFVTIPLCLRPAVCIVAVQLSVLPHSCLYPFFI